MASLGAAASSLGAASLLSICINARYHISRSLSASILFPYIIEDAARFKTDRLVKLAQLLRIPALSTKPEDIVAAFSENIRQRLAKANLPARLKDLSVTIEQLALAAEDAGRLDIINNLPRSMTTDDLFGLIKLAY
jgi:alcohol dehydrogenase